MLIKCEKIYNKEINITPEKFWINRRNILKAIGFSGIGLINFPYNSYSKDQEYISKNLNPRYKFDRRITDEKYVTTYNNFYEFGSSKNIL